MTALSALANNKTLKILDLSYNAFGDEGAIILARNTTLIKLNVNTTRIGPPGALALSENQTFEELDMGSSNMGIVGAAAFAGNRTLKKLEIEILYNYGDDKYVPMLIGKIELNIEFQIQYIVELIKLLNIHFPVVISSVIQQYADKEFPSYYKEQKLSSSALFLFKNPLRQHPNMILINSTIEKSKCIGGIKENKQDESVSLQVKNSSWTSKEIRLNFIKLADEFNRCIKKEKPNHVDIVADFNEETSLVVLKNININYFKIRLEAMNAFLDTESNLLIENSHSFRRA